MASNGNGRRPMILGRDGQAVNPDDRPITRAEVKALMVEIVGSLAHSFMELEKKHNALVEAMGLKYNPPQEVTGGQSGDLPTDREKEVPESGGGGPAPEGVEAPPP